MSEMQKRLQKSEQNFPGEKSPYRVVFLALDARFTHSNPALRGIIAWLKKQVEIKYLPELILLEHNINQSSSFILEKILETQPSAVFISSYIWNIKIIQELLPDLRQLRPDLLLGLGGPELAYELEQSFAQVPEADLIFCGEGEQAYEKLFRLWGRANWMGQGRQKALDIIKANHKTLCGLAYKEGEKILQLPLAAPLNLNELPFIYPEDLSQMRHRYFYYESSRACPFHCAYCLSANDDELRFRDVELVKQDLDKFITAGVPLVKFIDRSFNADRQRARIIWQHILDRSLTQFYPETETAHTAGDILEQAKRKGQDSALPKISSQAERTRPSEQNLAHFTRFHFEIEARLLEEEDFQLLAQMPQGLLQFEIGIQSFDPQVLRAVNRSTDTQRIVQALTRLYQAARIHCHIDLLFGLPEQDLHTIAFSFEEALKTCADKIQLGFLKVLKGTPLYQSAKERGFIWQKEAPYEILATDLLSYEDICNLKHLEAVFERFWDYELFARSMHIIQNEGRNNFRFFWDMGRYFYTQGYLDRSLSQNEFYARVYEYISKLEHSPIAEALEKAIKEDYMALPPGRLSSWEKLRARYLD